MSRTKQKRTTLENKSQDRQMGPSEIKLVYEASLEDQDYLIPVPKNYKLTATLLKSEPKDNVLASSIMDNRYTDHTLFRESQTPSTSNPNEKFIGNFSQGAEYDILKLQRMIFEHKTHINMLLGEKGALLQDNQLLTNLVKGKERDIMETRAKRLSLIPFTIFSIVLLSMFVFALTSHVMWRNTGVFLIKPETSYLLALTSFGLLATSVTGLVVRGKHGIGRY